MQPTTPAHPGQLTARPVFGPPALRWPQDRSPVSATATGSFSAGLGARVVEVEVLVDGVLVTVHVCAGRVCGPTMRGERAVRFQDRARAREVHEAALSAARDAELAGWLR